ncbi:hypothetical protein FRC12_001579 [Ceratobasidium sp. 428]|nr:hypothetical protein FRC12_001579 [Ceratobasidium sp. 428]
MFFAAADSAKGHPGVRREYSNGRARLRVVTDIWSPQADSLLRGDMTQAEKIVVKLDNDCNQDTGSGETYLEVPRFEPVISATEHAVIEATEQQESTTLVELLIQLLCKNRDPAQPRLNDIQEDDEVSKIMAHSDIVSSSLLRVTEA